MNRRSVKINCSFIYHVQYYSYIELYMRFGPLSMGGKIQFPRFPCHCFPKRDHTNILLSPMPCSLSTQSPLGPPPFPFLPSQQFCRKQRTLSDLSFVVLKEEEEKGGTPLVLRPRGLSELRVLKAFLLVGDLGASLSICIYSKFKSPHVMSCRCGARNPRHVSIDSISD